MRELVDRVWDVIVIGTGMGGGTAGRALAEAGKSVLFLEKGRQGFRTERQGIDQTMMDPVARSIRGFWPDHVHATVNGRQHSFFAPLGSGPGGSSVFYAAALERPEPHDLDHSDARPHPTGGWPVSYEQMRPWLDAAEAMFHVHGEMDPLCTVPCPGLTQVNPSAADSPTFDRLRANGQHPYHLHTATARVEGCLGCLGVKCPRVCKMDGRSAGVEPALATGRATLLDECEVTALHGTADQITHVGAIRHSERLEFRARQYVLAAGALNSPRLLLTSRNAHWPEGCANENDQVGRHLMFHLNELFAIWPPNSSGSLPASRSLSMRDLYMIKGRRMGMVQAMGINASRGLITQFIKEQLEEVGLRRFSRLAQLASWPATRMLGTAQLLVGLLEDMPYAGNRVTVNTEQPARIQFEYTIHPELRQRRSLFRKAIKRAFKGLHPVFGGWAPNLNYGHACGTLRSGTDPRTSVVDANCRAHGVNNLYVTDASFFPTSMGVNPSLTIAANALRVAHQMSEKP